MSSMRKETYSMTEREMAKLNVVNLVVAKTLTVREAASLLNLSERQVYRLKKGVLEQGSQFVIHKNRGRKPMHALSDELKAKIVALKKSEKYKYANFRHFRELLEKYENISISYSALHRILTESSVVSPKKKRKIKVHHRRKRKPQEGLLVQIDASPHPWLIDGNEYSLHGIIDDASGKVLGLHFEKEECLKGYFEVMEQMLVHHGIPVSIYSDRHSIFLSPKSARLSIEEQLQGKRVKPTQFGRAMQELGITTLFAQSPQAKGRIERFWGTLQSRLPIELKIRGITSIEEANAFLPSFIEEFNKTFSVQPENSESAFQKPNDNIDLSTILCVKEERRVSDGSGFSYNGQYYQIASGDKLIPIPFKTRVTVLDNHKTPLRVQYKNVVYDTKLLDEKPFKHQVEKPKAEPMKTKPADNHPWKRAWKISAQKKPRLGPELPNSSRAWV